LTLSGTNLSEPKISRTTDGKIIIKFNKTQLGIKSPIKTGVSMIPSIRSSDHQGTAWVVLDNNGLENWTCTKDKGDIVINFSALSASAKDSKAEKVVAPPAALTPSSSAPASLETSGAESKNSSRLIEASIKPLDNGIKLIMTSDGPSKYVVRKLTQPDKLIVHFLNTRLEITDRVKNFKNDDLELRRGGLLSLEMRQLGPGFSPISEALLTLMPGTVYEVDRNLNQVVIALTAPQPVSKPVEKRGNLNQLVSLDIENADLNVVVKTLASEAGFDVDFMGGSLSGTVNEKFKDVPLKTALAILLSPGSYAYDIQGNTLRIGLQSSIIAQKGIMPHVTEILSPSGGMAPLQFDTLVRSILAPTNAVKTTVDAVRNVLILNGTVADIEDYKKTIQDLKLDEGATSDRITKVVKLNYSDPAAAAALLGPYLTPVGKVQIDPRTTSLVIWEVASNMGVLLELIKEFDIKIPQVLIESNIVEVNSENDLNLGVQWTALSSNASANPTFNGSVSLPAGGAAPPNFQFGTIRSGLDIAAQLQALETHNKGKIISRPKIATGSGIPAEINVIENVVLTTTTETLVQGGTAQFTTSYTNLPLPIDLKVTPRITDDGRITSVVNASITSQTGPAVGSGAPPPTSIETATTTLTTKNGETIVIGGLMRETMTDDISGVPLLSSIPIIGTLFQSHNHTMQKLELIIFITPTLMED
jgi:type II secretory pathway component GspD/PulD (secretin)